MFHVACPLALRILFIPRSTLLPRNYSSKKRLMDHGVQGEAGLLDIGNNLLGHCRSTRVSSQDDLCLFAEWKYLSK